MSTRSQPKPTRRSSPPSGVIVADLTATATGTVSDGAATEGSAPITATVQSAAPVTVINHAGSPTGTLTNVGQHDWIAVSLVANQAYEITVGGLSAGAAVTVQTANGTEVPYGVAASSITPGTATDNYTYFMPSSSGTYYVDVADPYATMPESYTVSVVAVTADVTDNASHPGNVTVGGAAANGTLANVGQHDWIAVSLTANQAYEITVTGLSADAAVTVQSSTGTEEPYGVPASLVGALGGTATNNYAYFMPKTTGTYYIDVADPYAATPESYTVSVASVTADYTDNASHPGSATVGGAATNGTLANVGQHDWIAVSLTANQAYEITVTGLSADAAVRVQSSTGTVEPYGVPATLLNPGTATNNYTYFMPTSTRTYYIDVADPYATTPESYTVSVASVTADYTDNASHPGNVTVGGAAANGTLANVGQHDWIAVSLTANEAYEITVTGLSADAAVTVQSSTGTEDPYGVPASLLSTGTATNNYTYFMPKTTGTYYIDVADPYATTPESYTVSVASVTADVTDNANHPGSVTVGGAAANGTLANVGQHDWIAVSLTANQAYEITVTGLSADAAVTVQSSTGTDEPYGVPASLLSTGTATNNYTYFMPKTTGTYYIDVADPYATTPESYSVSVAAVSADYSDNTSHPGSVGVTIPPVVVSSGATSGGTLAGGQTENVLAGGTASGTVVSSGGALTVSSGGHAISTTVSSGGSDTVSSGGTASNTTLRNSGTEYVGGTASGTVVSGGGTEHVLSGGSTVSGTVSSGGFEYVSAGGSATSVTVESGGTLVISSGGTATDITVAFGGTLIGSATNVSSGAPPASATVVSSGHTSSGIILYSGSTETVLSGGTASATVISGGGNLYVSAGGKANATTISSGGTARVSSGGVDSGTIVKAGGAEEVSGTASGTVVIGVDALQFVWAGGVARGTVVSSGGYQGIGGAASGTIVSSGGEVDVYSNAQLGYNGSASGVVVSNGGAEYVLGGTASGTVVRSGGSAVVQYGTASGSIVSGGGTEIVQGSAGLHGTARGTTLSGGTQSVSSGGITTSTIVSSGGSEVVSSGGTASATIVRTGGEIAVTGLASGTVLSGGGSGYVSSGGVTSATLVSSGGVEYVVGGTASFTTVKAGGTEIVSSGATVSTVLSSGGTATVSGGGVGSGTIVRTGGKEYVAGTASGTVVSTGGNEYVLAGGKTISSVLSSGGSATVSAGGAADASIVQKGGKEYVTASGTASGATVGSSGTLYVSSGGTAIGTMVSGGGLEFISSAGTISGGSVITGGKLTLYSGGVLQGGLAISGGTAVISGAVSAGPTVTFAGPGGDLALYGVSGASFAATISGFTSGDTIDLGGFAFSTSGKVNFSAGTLTVSEGGKTATLTFAGGYATSNFILSKDTAGTGTFVKFTG